VAEAVLAPQAEATDQAAIVPTGHLRALADAGLFGLFAPGTGASQSVAAEVYETLAGACGATFFVWVQHHAPVRLLASSPNTALRARLLPALVGGEVLGGVAFAHLRRPGPPPVAARHVGGGYVFSGEAPWVTSWGLAGMFAVAARVADRVLYAAVDAHAAGLRPSPPLRLAAMNASATVRLGFEDVAVADDDVIVDLPFEEWQAQDRLATARPNPAAFGVAATCTRLLAERDPRAAAALEAERLDCRARSYAADPTDAGTLVGLRAWSLELALRCGYALVAATGGASMVLTHPAQRLLREAAFYAIQAQTPALRTATLARLSAR
jgi:alkylation response protein AidB-like acyl-CoA dehydrogenase